jgi:hypothetical protein
MVTTTSLPVDEARPRRRDSDAVRDRPAEPEPESEPERARDAGGRGDTLVSRGDGGVGRGECASVAAEAAPPSLALPTRNSAPRERLGLGIAAAAGVSASTAADASDGTSFGLALLGRRRAPLLRRGLPPDRGGR